MRKAALAGLGLLAGGLALPALAFEDEAAVDAALEQAKVHLKAQRWSAAVDAYKRVLTNYPGSNEVLKRLDPIETGLRRAMFRRQAKHPSAAALFGTFAKGFIVPDRRVTFEYPDGPVSPDWTPTDQGQVHEIPFDSDVALEFLAPTLDKQKKTIVDLTLRSATPSGRAGSAGSYIIIPGACSEDETFIYSEKGRIVRTGTGPSGEWGPRTLVEKPAPGKVGMGQVQVYRIVRRGTELNISVDGKPFLVCQDSWIPVVKVSIKATDVRKLVVRGVLEKGWYEDVLEKRYEQEQKEWEPTGYVRSEVLPPWILEAKGIAPNSPKPSK